MVKNILKVQPLDQPGIDRISEQLQEWLTQEKVERKNVLRLRLAMENLLEDLCLHCAAGLRRNTDRARRRIGAVSDLRRLSRNSRHPCPDGRFLHDVSEARHSADGVGA